MAEYHRLGLGWNEQVDDMSHAQLRQEGRVQQTLLGKLYTF
jgi:hypothetical protein